MKREYDFSKAKRGAVDPLPPGKTRITIRLDDSILEWFKAQVHAAGGGNYQSLINAALAEHIRRRKEPLEEILRMPIQQCIEPREQRSESCSSEKRTVAADDGDNHDGRRQA